MEIEELGYLKKKKFNKRWQQLKINPDSRPMSTLELHAKKV